jgi:hypothetical protein
MLYQQLVSMLEDHAELVPSSPDGPSTHSRWIITSELEPEGQWLENALLLNPYLSDSEAVRNLVNTILEDVSRVIRISSRRRSYDALKAILLTLWVSHLMGTPVRYSRRKNDYVRGTRYGKVYFKYDRIIPLVDALESRGFIKQIRGWNDRRSGIGRQSRMWGTMRLWNRFRRFGINDHSVIIPPEPEELIVLRDGSKGDSEPEEIQIQRDQLRQYNEFVKHHSITVDLPADCEVGYDFLLIRLQSGLRTNRVSLIQCILRPATLIVSPDVVPVLSKFTTSKLQPHYTSKYTLQILQYYYSNTILSLNPSSITDTNQGRSTLARGIGDSETANLAFLDYLKRMRFKIESIEDEDTAHELYLKKFRLKDIGVDRLVFSLNSESLHRVYNRGSFSCNGRAYGALHQNLAKHMRPFIRINDRPTIELDFSALHILMLYHHEGIDYQGDPYVAPGGKEMRKIFKAVGLVAINAENPKEAYGAIRDELKARGIPLPQIKRPLVSLVEMFRNAHAPIAKHLFSDAGIWLQNLDSRIMNAILMRLMERDILGLPVHDSVIVQREHQEALREIMMREYEAVMGFRPRLPEIIHKD